MSRPLHRPGDLQCPERIQDVLVHLFQHDVHPRGQARAMLAGPMSRHPSSTSSTSSTTRLCAPMTCARWGSQSAEPAPSPAAGRSARCCCLRRGPSIMVDTWTPARQFPPFELSGRLVLAHTSNRG
jgi:hypothetical protein